MFFPAYINVAQYPNNGSTSSVFESQYSPLDICGETNTVDVQKLFEDSVFIASYRQDIYVSEINTRIDKIYKSFMENGGRHAGIVAWKVFLNIAIELVDLPFSDVLAQFSPSNDEIVFDLVFNKRIELSVGKYLDSLDDDNVMYSISIDNAPYTISCKNLYKLKDVLLESLAE